MVLSGKLKIEKYLKLQLRLFKTIQIISTCYGQTWIHKLQIKNYKYPQQLCYQKNKKYFKLQPCRF
jgi:hypothetical protein